jgi:hypothetical protein
MVVKVTQQQITHSLIFNNNHQRVRIRCLLNKITRLLLHSWRRYVDLLETMLIDLKS